MGARPQLSALIRAKTRRNGLYVSKGGWQLRGGLFTPALGRKPEEIITSDLVAGGFPTDMGEGGVNLAIPLVSAIEYVYLNQLAFVNAYQLVAGFEFDIFALGGDT